MERQREVHDAHSLLLPCLQLVDLYEKIFNKEAELREFFDEEKITEGKIPFRYLSDDEVKSFVTN